MKFRNRTLVLIASCSAAFLTVACGKSWYSAFSKKETNESRLEDAKIALDGNNFSKARSILSGLWDDDKSSDIAQLYVIAMLGSVDLDIFTLIKKTLELSEKSEGQNLTNREIYSNFPATGAAAGGKSKGKNENPGNDIVDKIKDVLPSNLNNETITETLKSAIGVLHEKKGDSSVVPLTCFVGAIYTNLVLQSSQDTLKSLNDSIQSNIAKIGPTCAADTAESAGKGIKDSLAEVSRIAAAMDKLIESADACLGDGGTSVNSLKTSLDKLYEKADTGCTIGTTGAKGVPGFPTCATKFIDAAGGSNSPAGDKNVDGCELFVNCVGKTGNDACF